METTIFDDGSTLSYNHDTGYAAATPSQDTYYNNPSASWAPSSANPAANSWEDVLKFGLARTIDASVRRVKPENTVPAYQNSARATTGALNIGGLSLSLPMLLVIGAIAYFALK